MQKLRRKITICKSSLLLDIIAFEVTREMEIWENKGLTEKEKKIFERNSFKKLTMKTQLDFSQLKNRGKKIKIPGNLERWNNNFWIAPDLR